MVIHLNIKKKKGKTIDLFKTVIRFNDYKVKKYVNYTGKKTNICFISNSNYKKIIPTKKISTVLVENSLKINAKNAQKFGYFIFNMENILYLRHKHGPLRNIFNFLNFTGSWLNLIYPKNITTGLLTILTLVESNIKPTITGIDYNYQGNSQYFKHHKNFSETHWYFYEKLIIKRLIKNKLIKIL